MNAREAFPGTGLTDKEFRRLVSEEAAELRDRERKQDRADSEEIMSEAFDPDHAALMSEQNRLMAEALAEDMASELPTPSPADKDRGIFERSIAARRAEKAKQQAIAAAALAKARQLTASIRSMEDALDGLAISEVA